MKSEEEIKKKRMKSREEIRISNEKYYQKNQEKIKETHRQNYHMTEEEKFDKKLSRIESRVDGCSCLSCFEESKYSKENCYCMVDCVREASCDYSCLK